MAKKYGVDRVICRLESSNEDAKIKAQGIEVFSNYLSNKILLKGLIETPNMLNLKQCRNISLRNSNVKSSL